MRERERLARSTMTLTFTSKSCIGKRKSILGNDVTQTQFNSTHFHNILRMGLCVCVTFLHHYPAKQQIKSLPTISLKIFMLIPLGYLFFLFDFS